MTSIAALALVLLLVTAAAPVRAQSAGGLYSLSPGGAPIPEGVLDDPRVAGVTVRWRWQQVEIAPGVRDWSYFDTEIARVAAAGKSVFLKITAGGINVPPYVVAQVATFSWTDGETGHTLTMPLFWDAYLLNRKYAFIAAIGSRYRNHPAVRAVGVSCANAKTDDWNVPHEPDDIERWKTVAGYTSGKLVNVCKTTITRVAAAFPTQTIVLPIGSNGQLDPTPNHVATTVADWGLATYPGRFKIARHALNARTPLPDDAGADWRVVYDRRPNAFGQMLAPVTVDDGCRLSGSASPADPAGVLTAAIRTGAAYEMPLLELYDVDILDPALRGVIDEAALLFPPR
jgi:hypothetical protein